MIIIEIIEKTLLSERTGLNGIFLAGNPLGQSHADEERAADDEEIPARVHVHVLQVRQADRHYHACSEW